MIQLLMELKYVERDVREKNMWQTIPVRIVAVYN